MSALNRRSFLKVLGITPAIPAIIRTSDDIPMPIPDPLAHSVGRFVALFREVEDGSRYIVEVDAADYARLPIQTEHFGPNYVEVTFPEAGEPWGRVVGAHIYDRVVGGNLLLTSDFRVTHAVNTGDRMRVSFNLHALTHP